MIPGSITAYIYKNGMILKVIQSEPPPKCPYTPTYTCQINFPKKMYNDVVIFFQTIILYGKGKYDNVTLYLFPNTNIKNSPDEYLSKVSKEAKKYKLLRYGK